MKIAPFLLERHFARYEFAVRWQLSCSDCEPLAMDELIAMASPELIRMWENLKFSYTESAGHPILRSEISSWYSGIKQDDIVVCVPEEGIFLVMGALLEPGDHVVVIAPAYQSLYEIAQSAGCHVSRWEADPDGTFNPESLRELITDATRMVVINVPHNPTGKMVSRQEFERIAGICGKRGIILLSDEMYRGLEQDPTDRLPGAASLGEHCISLSGVSKCWSLPGLRIGWLACRNPEIRDRLIALKDYTTICSSAPSEILAIMALQNSNVILERNRAIIRHNARLVDELIGIHKNLNWYGIRAGSVAMLNLGKGLTVSGFCDGLLRDKEVLAIGSHLFGIEEPSVRLGLGRNDFGEALERFGDYLKQVSDNQ